MTMKKPICHKDGTVSYWSVYFQWPVSRVRFLPDCELVAMNARDRARVIKHTANAERYK
jgi:hypothetical protein